MTEENSILIALYNEEITKEEFKKKLTEKGHDERFIDWLAQQAEFGSFGEKDGDFEAAQKYYKRDQEIDAAVEKVFK